MNRKFSYRDYLLKSVTESNTILIVIISLLCVIGLVVLYSASIHLGLPFFKKPIGRQLLWLILGAFAATGAFIIQRKLLYDSVYFIFGFGLFLLILPHLLGGSSSHTFRWVEIGPIHFQPSEFMKIFVILAIAKYLSGNDVEIENFKYLIIPLLLCIVPMVLILKQPDLGTSIIFLCILFPMLFWAGARLFHLMIIIAPFISILTAFNFYTFFAWVVALLLILYFTKEKWWISLILSVVNISLGLSTPILWGKLKLYQQNRILTLFNLGADPQGAGYQSIQSQTAIGSGGIFGKGFGQGTQTHLKFLPEQHNDFIFSVVGEEYGFIGVIVVLILFLLLTIVLLNFAYRVRDRFSSLVSIGIFNIFLFHVVINVAMTIGLMPVTGLPLPFLSYGGSFILMCFIAIGLVTNLSTERSGTGVNRTITLHF